MKEFFIVVLGIGLLVFSVLMFVNISENISKRVIKETVKPECLIQKEN